MRITSLIHKVKRDNQPQDYFEKIRLALKQSKKAIGKSDILIGPDYGLSFLQNPNEKPIRVRFELRPYLLEELAKISSEYPETLILPGTTPRIMPQGVMAHTCPAFLDGKLIREFFKETNCGDGEIAQDNGLVYEGRDSNKNYINHNGKIIAVEICSDHGRQIIPKNTFLEVIMAYDDNAGFSERPNFHIDRYSIVCDGRTPFTEAFTFEEYRKPEKKGFDPIKQTENWRAYLLR